MIGALFVEKRGIYNIEGIDLWDVERDARKYLGPHPVIAHPPCERWGRYWFGGPSAKIRRKLGDDNGCFESALASVRRFRGVLEHPEGSHAFSKFSLPIPDINGGWSEVDSYGGRSCCVAQGRYGHRACKMTWLYGVDIDFKQLKWGRIKGQRLDEGFHSAEERRLKRAQGQKPIPRLTKKENISTPVEFRDLLIELVTFDNYGVGYPDVFYTGSQPVGEKK